MTDHDLPDRRCGNCNCELPPSALDIAAQQLEKPAVVSVGYCTDCMSRERVAESIRNAERHRPTHDPIGPKDRAWREKLLPLVDQLCLLAAENGIGLLVYAGLDTPDAKRGPLVSMSAVPPTPEPGDEHDAHGCETIAERLNDGTMAVNGHPAVPMPTADIPPGIIVLMAHGNGGLMPIAAMQQTSGLKHVLTALHDAYQASDGPIIWDPSIDMRIKVPMQADRAGEVAKAAAEAGADLGLAQGAWGTTPIDEA